MNISGGWVSDEAGWGGLLARGDAELKLSIQAASTQLRISLIAARNLTSQRGQRCCSFVRISFYPEGQNSEKCQSQVVPDTDFPLFNEHFVLNLPLEHQQHQQQRHQGSASSKVCGKKNLLISAWNQLGREG
uniref:C2 domain-containing protein n=1 Tax=Macrostomum lignano TaxID=282301 RepID=A0A1I8HT34_9PLAT